MTDNEGDDLAAFKCYVDQLRPVQGLRSRKPEYRPTEELCTIREILTSAGFTLEGLRSRAKDPPDCEAHVDGKWSGIEHTELIEAETMERYYRDRSAPLYFREWTKPDFLAKLGEMIAEKDDVRPEDPTYARYFLVIETNEMHLTADNLAAWVAEAEFPCRIITDAFIGLLYPTDPYPTFKIRIVKARPTASSSA